jgi:diguanylate cyclase (GGDEF)-like protein
VQRHGRQDERPGPAKVLAFLARLAAEFTAVLSLSDLLDHIMRACSEEMGFDSCSVALADEREPGQLMIRAASGLRTAYLGMAIPAGKGLHGEVMATGRSLLVPDMAADRRVYRLEPNIRSGIYAPLLVHGRAIGVLSAHRSEPGAFSAVDLDLLTVVARYLAGAVEVARLHEQLRALAATDALTGLANRRAFLDRLAAEIARARRADEALSVALLDLDGFKAVNDTHGHTVGDAALLAVARSLTRSLRASDLVARFGGDEFTLLLPATARDRAQEILDRIRVTDVPTSGAAGGSIRLVFSWGIAVYPEDGEDPDRLLQVADGRLYAMKQHPQRQSDRTIDPGGPGSTEDVTMHSDEGQPLRPNNPAS